MILLLLACSGAKESGEPFPESRCGMEGLERQEPPLLSRDSELRINQIQARATHNSYHLQPEKPLDASWEYSQPPLGEQLDLYGVRGLELDLHLRDDGSIEVFHIPAADDGSNCGSFHDCLAEVCRWSAGHSGHVPLMIWLEPKDDLDGSNGYQSLLGHSSVIEQEIRDVFPADQLFVPDDWRRGEADLGTATALLGPPTLAETRGRVLFAYLDSSEHRDEYLQETPSLKGRVLFPDADGSYAALLKDASPADIPGLLAEGLVVTSNVDGAGNDDVSNTASRDENLAAGLNYAASDFPAPSDGYWMELPDASPVLCNPVSAPEGCVASEVEALE